MIKIITLIVNLFNMVEAYSFDDIWIKNLKNKHYNAT